MLIQSATGQLEMKTEDFCVIRESKPLGVYIMNFSDQNTYRARKRSPEGTRGAHEVGGAPSTLVEASCPPRTATYFSIFLNIPKQRKIAIRPVLESVYLPYHIPIPFRSLEHSRKCPLCIPPGLRFQ